MRGRRNWRFAATAHLVTALAGCGEDIDRGPARSGEELAAMYCQGCHLLPDPGALDRETWRDAVLPAMGHRLGIYAQAGVRDTLFAPGVEGEIVRQAGVFPDTPAMPGPEWQRLVDHYLAHAPDALPPPREPLVEPGVPGFGLRFAEFRASPPLTTLVEIDTMTGALYLGDTKQDYSTLEVIGPDGGVVQTLGLESAPTHLRLMGDSADVLLAGDLLPTDEPSGLLRRIYRGPDGQYGRAVRLLDGLTRPVHASYGDLDEDGRGDVIVSEFGFRTGRLSWYRGRVAGGFNLQVLKPVPGAIRTAIRDMDGDGRLDVLAQMAQGDEGVFLFHNQGSGGFREDVLLRLPPSYGSTGMELHDFNGDGHIDLLYTNGDLGDFSQKPRPYHGIRIFLNDGSNRFEERFFFPFNGAYGAQAADFDADGDLDIAAIAFYPDFSRPPARGFVYLRNRGDLTFDSFGLPETSSGRWITMDVADLDQDSDADIVLGSFVGFPPVGDATGLFPRQVRESPSYLILENLYSTPGRDAAATPRR